LISFFYEICGISKTLKHDDYCTGNIFIPKWCPNESYDFLLRSRKTKILTTPVRSAGPTGQAVILVVFRGLNFNLTQILVKKTVFVQALNTVNDGSK